MDVFVSVVEALVKCPRSFDLLDHVGQIRERPCRRTYGKRKHKNKRELRMG
jgi:hypothetical protein